jgi:hypothetical protein
MCGGEAEPAEVRILCSYLTGLDGLSNWNFWESVRNKEGALSAVPVACRRRHLLEFSWKADRRPGMAAGVDRLLPSLSPRARHLRFWKIATQPQRNIPHAPSMHNHSLHSLHSLHPPGCPAGPEKPPCRTAQHVTTPPGLPPRRR